MKVVSYIILLYNVTLYGSNSYMYPVACLKDGNTVLCIKQQSENSIQLLEWNKNNKDTRTVLWSLFKPSRVQLLPDESGFSFIDNGRVRIQYFNKRSPKTVDFDDYFYNIGMIHWCNPNEFYFSAQSKYSVYSIFKSNPEGETECVVTHKKQDCLYPQKIGSCLFYILKNGQSYSIAHTDYDKQSQKPDVILSFKDQAITFLTMVSKDKGFCIGYDLSMSVEQSAIPFNYYRLSKINNKWTKKVLFSFKIPLYLLYSDQERVVESLLPFVPRVINNLIYFVDLNSSEHLSLFVFDQKRSTIRSLYDHNKNYFHLFVPIIFKKAVFIGGQLI